MLSKNTVGYSYLAIAGVVTATLFLNSGLAEVIGDRQAAHIVTAIVVSFALGALLAITAIYFGAVVRGEGQATYKEIPPRKVFVRTDPGITNTSATNPGLTTFDAITHQAPTVLVENGIARIMDTAQQCKNTTTIEWVDFDQRAGQNAYRSIDVQTLRRFARLHTPSRAEWSGKATTYSECLAFFRYAGWVIPATVGNGVEWNFIYKKLQRRLQHLGDLATISQTLSPPSPNAPLLIHKPINAFS